MPGCLPGALKKAAFMAISLLLLPTPGAGAGEDFEAGLEEGRLHGTEMLSRHSQILRPSAVETEALPGYGTETRQELQSEGSRWTGDPEGMRAEAESTIQGGDPATSDAPGFLKRSSAQRPTFTIDPETDPMIASSKDAIESPLSSCEKKEVCTEYAESFWNEQKGCYDQATLSRHYCNVKKTVTVIPQDTESRRRMTLGIDRNEEGIGFPASVDADGDGNGQRVSYTATKTTYETHIETDDRCGDYEADGNCEPFRSRCLETTQTPDGETVCLNREHTYLCASPLVEGPDCAGLRADGCYQTGARCVMRFREHPELPDPPGADLGACLIQENVYDCPKNMSLCRKKSVAFDCGGKIRCASGDDCFDTSTEQNVDFPKVASRMAMLADMERCLATTRDGESSAEGYGPIEVDGTTGATAGPIDCADTSGGEVTIFKGKRYRCDLNLAGFIQNCCRKEGLFSGACPQSTKELRARRDDAGACHYVGTHKKKVLGVTLKKRKVYCCFNSKMARVIHEQTRGQLVEKGLWGTSQNGGWGRAKNPLCGGMTAEQLQEIDFDAVDFSKIYGDLLEAADIPDLAGSTESTEEDIEDLCPETSLGCGGEEEQ